MDCPHDKNTIFYIIVFGNLLTNFIRSSISVHYIVIVIVGKHLTMSLVTCDQFLVQSNFSLYNLYTVTRVCILGRHYYCK